MHRHQIIDRTIGCDDYRIRHNRVTIRRPDPSFLDLGSVPGQVALLMAALPTAANAFVLSKQFDISVEQNTATVLLSTAFSVITVSALLVWLHVT